MVDYKQYIVINPLIRFGKPIIKGTRITVYDVLSWLSEGMNNEEIINDFPEMDDIKIKACLSYAADKEAKLLILE